MSSLSCHTLLLLPNPKFLLLVIGSRSENTYPVAHDRTFPPAAQTRQLQPFRPLITLQPHWSHCCGMKLFQNGRCWSQWQTQTFTWTLLLLFLKNFPWSKKTVKVKKIEAPFSKCPAVFGFCPGWKSFHIPFLRVQRSASALPACPPAHHGSRMLSEYC